MQPLEKTLRNKLERTVKEARDVAEAAASAVLEQLGVQEAAPYDYLTDAERELRRRLRAHGRQLGNGRKANGEQELARLIEEVAYEHWHRMLFARFLDQNNLLMYPDPVDPVAVTLEECEDLAAEEGAKNGWELASRFAARMLPQIFRPDSPVFELSLPPEHQQKLERLLADLPQDVFTASDSLGWVYQFWQAKRKDQINASEVKIGARELPAVTQLFTEDYMVSFLLDNSLGAWWAARRLTNADLKNASTEQELRNKAAIPGVPLEYLRFVKTPSLSKAEGAMWTPAAGTFDGWPESLKEFKTLDPCCGSGHFLVAAFLMLVPMRIEQDGLSTRAAVDAVLRENIHGLEIDQRCVELAAFALALTAWRYPDAGGYRPLPDLNIACSGLSVSLAKEEWMQLSLGKKNLTIALDWMHHSFQESPVLGSLLNPAKTDAVKLVQWGELSLTLEEALSQEQTEEQHEGAVVAQGLAKAAILMAGQYQWVITNVPYLKSGKQGSTLKSFCEQNYAPAKADLATVFLARCMEFCAEGGTSSVVLPQNWLFLTAYRQFREKLLNSARWHLIAKLGSGAFETISGEVVKAILITLSRGNSFGSLGRLFEASNNNLIRGIDVSNFTTLRDKAESLAKVEICSVAQNKQLENPDSRIVLEESTHTELLSVYATGNKGITTNDDPHFVQNFWEQFCWTQDWETFHTTVRETTFFGGMNQIFLYEQGKGQMRALSAGQDRDRGRDKQGRNAWAKKGVAVSCMGLLPVAAYTGSKFDTNIATVIPNDLQNLPAVWCFCSSAEYNDTVRQIDQSLKVTNATLVKVPFDLDHWTKVAEEKYPKGLPNPYSDDPTQWVFHGHVCGSVVWDETAKWTTDGPLRVDNTVLQVAIARLLGYRWPAELGSTMEVSAQASAWVKKSAMLLCYADDDGIVCIPPVRGEAAAADRLLNLLAASYGDAWSNHVLAQLLKVADHASKSLESWLREKFFLQHCKFFQHRPFIWHIWDGLRDGFAALVNYHKLNYKTLETLIYTYLGEWIGTQKDAISKNIDGAAEKLAAAEVLKKRLEQVLEGEAPYDIFVRWKPIDKQPIGWNPDLNDGVRLNIRPFLTAGVLRFNKKPQINISWDKDRGKDIESAPWYRLFDGERINDHHLSLMEKRAAQLNQGEG